MIEVTVKTLDSQNHRFSVENDITVAQFKKKIAGCVNIPAETQRMIYCGRVLQDNAKLNDYDVDGKVVHLVQRPPPSAQEPRRNRPDSPSPHQQQRQFRGMGYLGSMRLPAQTTPNFPTHTLAGSRLNVARRMLRRAETALTALENPSVPPPEPPAQEEPQEEVTPVFEARVIVPSNDFDEAVVLSAVQNTLLEVSNSIPLGTASQPASSQDDDTVASNVAPDNAASSSSSVTGNAEASQEEMGDETAASSSEGESQAPAGSGGTENSSGSPGSTSHTTEYATLLDNLHQFHARLAPHLERYRNFMREDPVVSSEDIQSTQTMINSVSEILHLLGHAYHSLSDIIVRARTPPPRPLLCRPIIIQHSAVLQAGIPIQVEAQFNLAPQPRTNAASTNNSSDPSPNNANQAASNGSDNTPLSAGMAPGQPTMVGLLPGGVHMGTFVIPTGNILPSNGTPSNSQNRTSHAPNSDGNEGGATAQSVPATTSTTSTTSNGTFSRFGPSRAEPQFSLNNPNMEFFMEVTPEGITIDSVETSFVEGTSDMLSDQPSLLQSLMQMAGQVMSHGTNIGNIPMGGAGGARSGGPPSTTAETAATESQTSSANGSRRASFQNSQARGNTQTHPTTSTHTRSTARPHVHLAQHAMQGFDPYLPCSSHHICTRQLRSQQARQTDAQPPSQGSTAPSNGETNDSRQRDDDQNNPLHSLMQSILNSVRFGNPTGGPQNEQQQSTSPTAAPTTGGAAGSGGNENRPYISVRPASELFSGFLNLSPATFLSMGGSETGAGQPTIAQLLQYSPDESDTGILSGLIALITRNLTILDMVALSRGRTEPLTRISSEMRQFLLTRALDNDTSRASIDRAVGRLLIETQPYFVNLSHLQTRDNIDIVRSVQSLFRRELPTGMTLATAQPQNAQQLTRWLSNTSRMLWALLIHSSRDGIDGVTDLVNHLIGMQDIPPELQHWPQMLSRMQLQLLSDTINICESHLQPYIVRTGDTVAEMESTEAASDEAAAVETMQVDVDSEVSGNENDTEAATPVNLDDGTLPSVTIGTEPWHEHVPVDWVPIITRDNHRQRKQTAQAPFSDAYLSGMPSKRRKIIDCSKQQGSVSQVIAESVRNAITVTGLASIAPLETVSEAAGTDRNIQTAYRDLLRTTVQSNLRDNEDFTPERFPNATNFFNNRPQ